MFNVNQKFTLDGSPGGYNKGIAKTDPVTILRLYGALEPWFDKTWRPGEIELVK
jgi:hypothetical protein